MEHAIYFPWLAPFISNDSPVFSLSLDFTGTYYLWTLESPWGFSRSLWMAYSFVSLDTIVTVCVSSVLAGGGPGGSSQSVSGLCSWRKIIFWLLNKRGQLLFQQHWLSYISPKRRLCIGFVKCHVRLVPPSVCAFGVSAASTLETLARLLWRGSASWSSRVSTGCEINWGSWIYC